MESMRTTGEVLREREGSMRKKRSRSLEAGVMDSENHIYSLVGSHFGECIIIIFFYFESSLAPGIHFSTDVLK